MTKRRDRHARGLRGPLAPAGKSIHIHPPQVLSGRQRFAQSIHRSLEKIEAHCPTALIGIDIAYEDVPTQIPAWEDRIPLATANSSLPEQNGQVILFRRPIERRAGGDIARLVHRTIVEQLSAATGIPLYEIDPEYRADAD